MKELFIRLAVGVAFAAAAFSAHAGETLDRVMEKKAMVVATNSGWPPQSYLDDSNEMVGFDIDVSREIAKRLVLYARRPGYQSQFSPLLKAQARAGKEGGMGLQDAVQPRNPLHLIFTAIPGE